MKRQRLAPVDYLKVIVKWRKFIIRNVFIVSLLAVVVSLLLQHKYTSTATILPPNPEQELMFGLYSARISAGLSSLARAGSFIPGMATPSDLYAAIMNSDRIKKTLINKYSLKKEFGKKTMIDASEVLDDLTEIEVSPEGIISVSVTYKDKYLATDLANSYVEEVDKFNSQTTMTVGKRYRMFIEERLQENIDSLRYAENAFRQFQEKHRTIALDIELENVIKTIAELKSQIILLEVKKGALSSSSQFNNPYLRDISRELAELRKQLSSIEFGKEDSTSDFGAGFSVPLAKIPEVSLEYARLLRDVKIQEAIYELLTEQYEQAKIMEVKDTPTIQILDKASPPELRSWPRRTLIVVLSFFLSLLVSIFVSFVLEHYKIDQIPQAQKESWSFIAESLRDDFVNLKQYVRRKFRKQ